MALPQLKYPEYTVTVPSTGEKVKMRPYTVGEEKILLMALEGQEKEDLLNATRQILGSCFEGLVFENLKTYDIDFLFLKLREVSVSGTIDVAYKVKNCPLKQESEDKTCEKDIRISIKLADAKIQNRNQEGKWTEVVSSKKDGIKEKIDLGDGVGMSLRHPTYDELSEIEDSDLEEIVNFLCVKAIDSIWDSETVYDFTDEEAAKFFGSLLPADKEKVVRFVDNIPILRYETEYKCPSCDFKTRITMEGLEDFFG